MGCFDFMSGPKIPQPPYQPPFQFPEFEMPEFSMPEFPKMEFPEFPEQIMPEFPKPFDVEGAEAKRRQSEEQLKLRDIEMRRKGYRSTLLTGGMGDETDPSLRKPSLLGR